MKDTQYTAKVFSNYQSKCCKAQVILFYNNEEDKCFFRCKKCGQPCEYEDKTSWFKRLLNKICGQENTKNV